MDLIQKYPQPKHEQAPLAFLKWISVYNHAKPFQVFTRLPLGVPSTNLVFESDEDITIEDLRSQEKKFNLDDHGFQLCVKTSKFQAFDDAEKVEDIYIPEVEALIRKHVDGADRIVFFDWRVRMAFQYHGLRRRYKTISNGIEAIIC